MTGDDYGIRWVTTYQQSDMDVSQQWRGRQFMPGLRAVPRTEHPFPIDGQVIAFETMYAETGRLLRKLEEDVRLAGGGITICDFAEPADIQSLPEALIFNCTGLGSRVLFGDTALIPVRGQLAVLLPQPEIRYAFGGQMGYMFPRADGILLGGTFERGVELAEPQPGDIDRILANHAAFFGGFRCTA
jgi:hypothetical protein